MPDPFDLEAKYYDRVWGSSCNYKTEAYFIHEILKKHSSKNILDLGCGTGGHCLEFAKLGYKITGIDGSQVMIEKAKNKLSNENLEANFVLGEMTQAYNVLLNTKTKLPFDVVICMGNTLAHMINDELLEETLTNINKLLKRNGIFIFWVNNAKQLQDDLLRKLMMERFINEKDLQLALLDYNFRDEQNEDVLIWNTSWLINDGGKIDFRIRTHPLRFFHYDKLKEKLAKYTFSIVNSYGDTTGKECFVEDKHQTIYVVTQKS